MNAKPTVSAIQRKKSGYKTSVKSSQGCRSVVMPITVEKNEERAKSLKEGGNLKKETLQRRQRGADEFGTFVKDNYDASLEFILESQDIELLEQCLIDYFERFSLGG